jgi:beta-aspartyl-peptidase (threonine type)
MPIAIVVHGGAGDIEPDEHAARLQALRTAINEALPILKKGGSALDAVEAAVISLESHPLLNAGRGSVPNRDGEIELDAMIMDGSSAHIGAVGAVKRIEHPVSLARFVMERTKHHLLVGPGAEKFAAEQGMPHIDPASLIVTNDEKLKVAQGGDTVGAVALDSLGSMAVAVSTGGIRGKLPGRVGDSPIAGAGGYADNRLGAACATGTGEGIIRALLTFRAVDAMANFDVQSAAMRALEIFTIRFNGDGGLIALDKAGRVGIAHNTAFMPVAYSSGEKIFAQVTGQGPLGH